MHYTVPVGGMVIRTASTAEENMQAMGEEGRRRKRFSRECIYIYIYIYLASVQNELYTMELGRDKPEIRQETCST